MIRTLSGWIGNALDELSLLWAEPVTWLILAAAIALAVWRSARQPRWHVRTAAAYFGAVGWLIATLAITVYPITISFDPPPWERVRIESIVPLADTIQSLGNMRDRTMSPQEHEALTARLAADLGIPPEEVNLSWQIQGANPAGVLRDPVGNLLLFTPLGALAALARRQVSWRHVALIAASISGIIELSQLLFGLGSLASGDDVIFNTLGAVAGLAVYRLIGRAFRRARSTPESPTTRPTDVIPDGIAPSRVTAAAP